MPLINFECDNCECKTLVTKYFNKVSDVPSALVCPKCGCRMDRTLGAPSQASKFTIDNGLQAKAVEVIDKIWEMNEEASKGNR